MSSSTTLLLAFALALPLVAAVGAWLGGVGLAASAAAGGVALLAHLVGTARFVGQMLGGGAGGRGAAVLVLTRQLGLAAVAVLLVVGLGPLPAALASLIVPLGAVIAAAVQTLYAADVLTVVASQETAC